MKVSYRKGSTKFGTYNQVIRPTGDFKEICDIIDLNSPYVNICDNYIDIGLTELRKLQPLNKRIIYTNTIILKG